MTATTTRRNGTERLLEWIRALVRAERDLEARGADAEEIRAVRREIASLLAMLAAAARAEAAAV